MEVVGQRPWLEDLGVIRSASWEAPSRAGAAHWSPTVSVAIAQLCLHGGGERSHKAKTPGGCMVDARVRATSFTMQAGGETRRPERGGWAGASSFSRGAEPAVRSWWESR